MSKLLASEPDKTTVIREVVPRTITTLSVPFLRFGRVRIGGRSTIVRLQNGSLAVFSPVTLTEEIKRKVAELGEVKYITAPDFEHHISLGPWHQAYPNAKVLGPDGLDEKRRKQKNEDVPFYYIFKKDATSHVIDPEFDAEFDCEYVPGHQNKEIVFNHKPTKTLIQADLIFNYPPTEQYSKTNESPTAGILTKIFGALTSVHGTAQKRMIWYGISSGDRTGYARSVSKINEWDFDRIIPCHGDLIETGGKSVFQHIMSWHLDLAKKSS